MLTYRLQHSEEDEGPYCGPSWSEQDDMASAHQDERHPSPWRDEVLRDAMVAIASGDRRCATDSPRALLAWFDGYWPDLAESEYMVVTHEATRAAVGAHGQVVFDIGTAHEVERVTPEAFHAKFA